MARPVEKDPKIQLRIGVKTSVIEKIGGVKEAVKKGAELLIKESKKRIKK